MSKWGSGKKGLRLELELVQDNIPVEVVPRLWVGSLHCAYNQKGLRDRGITHILNVSGDTDAQWRTAFIYLSVKIKDKKNSSLLSCMPLTNLFIARGRRLGGVLVHCRGGKSRSPALVIAYLIQSKLWTYRKSLSFLTNIRPVVEINSSFRQQLKAYEKARSNVYVAQQILLRRYIYECLSKRKLHSKNPSGQSLNEDTHFASVAIGYPNDKIKHLPPLKGLEQQVCCIKCQNNLFSSWAILRLNLDEQWGSKSNTELSNKSVNKSYDLSILQSEMESVYMVTPRGDGFFPPTPRSGGSRRNSKNSGNSLVLPDLASPSICPPTRRSKDRGSKLRRFFSDSPSKGSNSVNSMLRSPKRPQPSDVEPNSVTSQSSDLQRKNTRTHSPPVHLERKLLIETEVTLPKTDEVDNKPNSMQLNNAQRKASVERPKLDKFSSTVPNLRLSQVDHLKERRDSNASCASIDVSSSSDDEALSALNVQQRSQNSLIYRIENIESKDKLRWIDQFKSLLPESRQDDSVDADLTVLSDILEADISALRSEHSQYVLGPMEWMGGISSNSGSLKCPSCSSVLGSWDWNGAVTNDGKFVKPAFFVNKKNVAFRELSPEEATKSREQKLIKFSRGSRKNAIQKAHSV